MSCKFRRICIHTRMGAEILMQWNISTYADIGKTDNRCASLPRLAGHALRTLEVLPYRCHQRMLNGLSVPITNLYVLAGSRCLMNSSSAAFSRLQNGEISGRFKGYDH